MYEGSRWIIIGSVNVCLVFNLLYGCGCCVSSLLLLLLGLYGCNNVGLGRVLFAGAVEDDRSDVRSCSSSKIISLLLLDDILLIQLQWKTLMQS